MRAVAVLCWLSMGCATLTARPEEYDAYRRVRVADTLEARLAASERYLKRHPEGRFASEVRPWYQRTEPQYFERRRGTRAGLEAYLDTLPEGPSAAAALERLAELDLADSYRRGREAALSDEARALEEKLAGAERLRAEMVETITGYATLLASIPRFFVRTHELPEPLIVRYRVQEPRARCGTDRCSKTLTLPYAIPDGGRLRARAAVVEVSLHLQDGGVARAEIAGLGLLARMGEALAVAKVSPDDPLARAEAIARAVTALAAALEQRLPEARCAGETVGTRVLTRSCDGMHVEVIAAENPSDDDRIVFSPAPR